MSSKALIAILFVIGAPVSAFVQNCTLTISGYVRDAGTGLPISNVNILLEESRKGAVSDSSGFFSLSGVCTGTFHLRISHIGCETQRLYLTFDKDTILDLELDHYSKVIEGVVVTGSSARPTTQKVHSINEQKITENANLNLSNMLESVSGVSALRTGYGIAKPVVHGLYGNRLIILNNGIAQAGQQWGNDHSPEIDPLAANKITVVKGVGVVEYPGSSLGSIISVEPKKVEREPHLHGKATYFLESNGWGNGLNLQLQQYSEKLAWKLSGTLKKNGDRRAADYLLRNTGTQEANIAIQLEKSLSAKWHSEAYISSFNTGLGILRGSHIGNLTDLQEALAREVPFFTEKTFSYRLEAPRQQVAHHLLKLHTRYLIDNDQWLDLTWAAQLNNREEFDVRRSGRTDVPALSLRQLAGFLESKYQRNFQRGLALKTGLQFNLIDNTNNPETGILPLIPDYLSYEAGAFGVLAKTFEKTIVELGARYDYIHQRVAAISFTLPREIIRYKNNFQNLNASAGISHNLSDAFKLSGNAGYASRSPAVNELYSNGLHQGVSGIEEGDPGLKTENAVKTTLSLEGRIRRKLFFEALLYHQFIRNYIFLNPQDEIRLTIRGAFPVFRYEQTDARISGFDVSSTYHMNDHFSINAKYSFIHGQDTSNDLPLVFLPSNNLFAALNYQLEQVGIFEHIEIEINHRYVFEQTRLTPEQDFAAAPPAYYLLGLRIAAQRQFSKSRMNIYAKADNMLDVSYRDYLNRQRYFADDLGLNATLGMSIVF